MTGQAPIRYATRPLAGVRPGARPGRAMERAAARALQAELDPTARLFSRSHSRGLVAAAVAPPQVTALGLDVEWIDRRRPMDEIARHFLGEIQGPVDPEQFYRGWTFGEAWFKAFGDNPPAELVRIAGTSRCGSAVRLEGAWLFQTCPNPGFVLSLVWAAGVQVDCERA